MLYPLSYEGAGTVVVPWDATGVYLPAHFARRVVTSQTMQAL